MKKQKSEEEKEEKKKPNQLEKYLSTSPEDHYTYTTPEYYVVSTGSLMLDAALGGGLPPGIHRIGGASEGGKALPVDELVLTQNGWVKIGSIKVGDEVVGKNGKPTKVIGVYPQGKKEIFSVSFEDGGEVKCCEDHLWETCTANERSLSYKKSERFSSVKNTRTIKQTLKYGGRYNHCIPYCDPVDFCKKSNLKIHPYVLGALLGDGGLTGDSVCLTNVDQELIQKVKNILSKESWFDGFGHNDITVRIRSKGYRNVLRKQLVDLGLMGLNSSQKFIPKNYIFSATIEDRINLLQGLMDTDGFVKPDSSYCQYYTVSERLAKDVQELVRSLGGMASINKKSSKYFSHKYEKWISCKDCWKVGISFANDVIPVSLTRKVSNHRKRKLEEGRKIVSISSVGEEKAVCIKVAALDGLFVTKDYIVTHNTSETLTIMENFLKTVPNGKALYVKAEGRLSEKVQERYDFTFVTDPSKWEEGTCFVLKSNIYEFVAQLMLDLVHNNVNQHKYMFVIDSLDGLILKDDQEKSFTGGESVKVCGPNVLTKRLFKQLSLPISEYGHIMVVITQLIAKIENKYDKKEQLVVGGSGGNAAIHFASFILKFLPKYNGDLILSSGDKPINTFGESNRLGHWASVVIEKSENETSGQVVRYPIKYNKNSGGGGIWNSLEVRGILDIAGMVIPKGSWVELSEDAQKRLTDGKIDFEKSYHGSKKFNEWVCKPEILDFWLSEIPKILKEKNLA